MAGMWGHLSYLNEIKGSQIGNLCLIFSSLKYQVSPLFIIVFTSKYIIFDIKSISYISANVKNSLDSSQLILSLTLGESLPGLGIVGEAPLGFPLNVAIKHEANDGHGGGEPAPVMYSVVCEDFDVAFSSFFPPMCVTTAKNDCYKVSKPTYYISIHSGDIQFFF